MTGKPTPLWAIANAVEATSRKKATNGQLNTKAKA
jgi:hypothetical protein